MCHRRPRGRAVGLAGALRAHRGDAAAGQSEGGNERCRGDPPAATQQEHPPSSSVWTGRRSTPLVSSSTYPTRLAKSNHTGRIIGLGRRQRALNSESGGATRSLILRRVSSLYRTAATDYGGSRAPAFV